MSNKRKVFIPNKSHHDFRAALAYGELVYLTTGVVDRYNVNHIFRLCEEAMQDACADDYLLVGSLAIINAAAASIMTRKFGQVNFLLYDRGRYMPRNIIVSENEYEDDEENTDNNQ